MMKNVIINGERSNVNFDHHHLKIISVMQYYKVPIKEIVNQQQELYYFFSSFWGRTTTRSQ